MRNCIRLFLPTLVGCAVIALFAHFWITDRLGVLRLLYPVQALLTQPTLQCSPHAPAWMQTAMHTALWDNASPASQIAYSAPDGSLHHCEHGWQDQPLLSPRVNEHSRFRYASMTKLLTADAVLRQRQAGTLALDTPILAWLPPIPALRDERIARITVEDLLRHSAGFDRLRSPDPMVIHATRPWCPGELAQLARARLDFDPGTRHAYSNLNYCLLGVILEQATHTGFRDLLEREYGLAARGIRFVDGPYLADEVRYDFRNSDFYGPDYSRHFDFAALSSSAGLSGSASALAALLAELHRQGKGLLTRYDVAADCRQDALRDCYGHAVFPYKAGDGDLRVHVQPGFLYAASSVAILDERGGVTVWIGNGMKRGGSSTDDMTLALYRALDAHYARPGAGSGTAAVLAPVGAD